MQSAHTWIKTFYTDPYCLPKLILYKWNIDATLNKGHVPAGAYAIDTWQDCQPDHTQFERIKIQAGL